MIPFQYERATDSASAVAVLTRTPGAMFLAGGTNLVDLMKLGVAKPDLLVDVSHLALDRVEPLPDGAIRVGAMVRSMYHKVRDNAFKVPLARKVLLRSLLGLSQGAER